MCSPLLQRRTAATEAQYLLMRHVFDDLGYRRYEWKCPDGSAGLPLRLLGACRALGQ
jgi:hypothetical protein